MWIEKFFIYVIVGDVLVTVVNWEIFHLWPNFPIYVNSVIVMDVLVAHFLRNFSIYVRRFPNFNFFCYRGIREIIKAMQTLVRPCRRLNPETESRGWRRGRGENTEIDCVSWTRGWRKREGSLGSFGKFWIVGNSLDMVERN